MRTLRFVLPTALALASTACIINTTDDDDDDTAGSSATTTSSETDASSGNGDVGGADSSGGPVLDCTMCSTDAAPDPLCHSSFDSATSTCVCDPGYEWENPDAPNDFACVQSEEEPADCGAEGSNSTTDANGNCACIEGYEWCTTDPDDLTCCEIQ